MGIEGNNDSSINLYIKNKTDTGGNDHLYLYGLYAGPHKVSNFADISLTATGEESVYAYGIYGDVGTNSGNITVTTTGGGTSFYYASGYTYGIDGGVGTNSGDITVIAKGVSLYIPMLLPMPLPLPMEYMDM